MDVVVVRVVVQTVEGTRVSVQARTLIMGANSLLTLPPRPCTCVWGTENYPRLLSKEDESRPQSLGPPELRQGFLHLPVGRTTQVKLRTAHCCEHNCLEQVEENELLHWRNTGCRLKVDIRSCKQAVGTTLKPTTPP